MGGTTIGKEHLTTCPLCEATCGLRIEVVDGVIVSIRGDRDDPFSRGHVCPKAAALQDIHEDPDRLRRPLRRTTTGWEEIGWDAALTEAARGLARIQQGSGRNAVAAYLGNPTVHNLGAMLFAPLFLRDLGSHNIYSATSVDQLPHMVAAQQIFGHRMLLPVPDLDRTDHLLVLGANPTASNGSMMTAPGVKKRLAAIRERGGTVVVIDPRRTETAAAADEHLFIRPGSDALFLMSLLREMLEAGPRLRHLDDLCDGVDRLVDLSADFPAELTARHTGIDADTVRRLSGAFLAAPSAACYGRFGTSTQIFGGLCQWLIVAVNAVSGNLDRAGGVMFTRPAFDVVHGPKPFRAGRGRFGARSSRVRGLPDFGGEFPVAALAEEILEPGEDRIRGVVCFAGNPVLSTPNGRRLDRALASLDFMVSVDLHLNETSRHADVILPPTSPLERSHYDIAFNALAVRDVAKFSRPVFLAPPEAMPDWRILLELKGRLGRTRGLRRALVHRGLRHLGPEGLLAIGLRFGPRGSGFNPFRKGITLGGLRRHPHGIDLGPLHPCLRRRLPASHPRVDLAPESFAADVARLRRLLDSEPKIRQEGSLSLIGRRHIRDNNSWLHNSSRLMRGSPRCLLFMHPADAGERGLASGDLAEITSRVGSLRVTVEVTDTVMPGVVSLPHGYGHDRPGIGLKVASRHAGQSVNDLTDDQAVDELTGTAAFSATEVRVSAV